MANWQSKLDLRDVWPKAQMGEMSVQELSRVVCSRLRCLKPTFDAHILGLRDELVDSFAELSTDDSATKEDFDAVFRDLYDWADIPLDNQWPRKKVCWVAILV